MYSLGVDLFPRDGNFNVKKFIGYSKANQFDLTIGTQNP